MTSEIIVELQQHLNTVRIMLVAQQISSTVCRTNSLEGSAWLKPRGTNVQVMDKPIVLLFKTQPALCVLNYQSGAKVLHRTRRKNMLALLQIRPCCLLAGVHSPCVP
jgi:hypothetical protein